MQSNVVKATAIIASILASGCASFQAHRLPVVQEQEYKVARAEKVKLFSRWKVESGSTIINKDAAAAIYKASFENAIKESGCCDIVEGPTEASLVIDGTAIDNSDASVLLPAFITGFSLYTIPSWVTQTIDLKVTGTAANKNTTYALNDSFTMVQWLPMLFAFPFTGGPQQNGEILNANTYRNLIVQLKKDGHI